MIGRRNQRILELSVQLSAGKHTLKLAAVDDHIIFDQWMVDFRPTRKFYVFPINTNQ